MSHKATNWAVEQRGIPPAAKVVLWHLANRHHPDYGCFPSQARLAEDCEMSRSSLNNQLNTLEQAGLIKRQKQHDKDTKQRKSTRYILGFEDDFTQDSGVHVQDLDMEAMSKNEPKPCPNSGQSHVQNLDTISVRGTSKRNGNPLCISPAADLLGNTPEPPPPKKKRAVALPDGWVPSARNVEDARNANFSDEEIRDEAGHFRDHHHARGTTFKNWDAAWRTWLRNARKFGGSAPRRPSGSRAHENLVSGFARALDQFH